jgi:hypothetical protein
MTQQGFGKDEQPVENAEEQCRDEGIHVEFCILGAIRHGMKLYQHDFGGITHEQVTAESSIQIEPCAGFSMRTAENPQETAQ